MNPIIVDEEKCVGCSLCVYDCPNACLHLIDGKAQFDKPSCIECGHCESVCPQHLPIIELLKEAGEILD